MYHKWYDGGGWGPSITDWEGLGLVVPMQPPAPIYFQGTDNKLWRAKPDGSDAINLGGYKANSASFVSADSVYFQGTDDTLWKINLDGSGGTKLGGYKASSTPFVTAENVYFQGTDDTWTASCIHPGLCHWYVQIDPPELVVGAPGTAHRRGKRTSLSAAKISRSWQDRGPGTRSS